MGYRIFVVDDEAVSLTNAKNLLDSQDMRVTCMRSGKDLLRIMEKNTPDLILLDILMPEMDGFETYRRLREFEEERGRIPTPVIFLTGENSSETESRGLKAGAADYIRKPFDKDILIGRINNTIQKSKMIESLTEEAMLDRLTGFWNKASGTEKVGALCKNREGALMILDLDNFKLVNDLYGHDMGDRILVAFSKIMKSFGNTDDVLCRIGGDEFMAFLDGVPEEERIASIVRGINERLSQEAKDLMGEDHGIPLGVSSGVALAPEHGREYRLLFQCADSALYTVKKNGKHGYEIYNPASQVVESTETPQEELARVTKIVEERGEGTGALFLGIEAFSWNYRFIMRFLKRYGGEFSRTLFSVGVEENDVLFDEIIAEFSNVLQKQIRKSDLIFQCKSNRFYVVLPLLSKENADQVIRRIIEAWEALGYGERAKTSFYTEHIVMGSES